MSHFTYVDNVNSNLICCICRMPFVKPVSTTTCSHTFCSECIITALSTSPQCPVDRSPLKAIDLQPANHIVRNLVDELIVECTNRDNGCLHTGQRQLLPAHLRDNCQFVQVPCSQQDCPGHTFRKDVQEHFSICKHRIKTCKGCGERIRAAYIEEHFVSCSAKDITCSHCSIIFPLSKIDSHETTCPDMIVTCSHASNGCSWAGPRHTQMVHLNKCPYEAVKDFISLNASRISILEVENSTLRSRLEELETSLRSVRYDVESTKLVLEPWCRQDSSFEVVRPSPPTEPAPGTSTRRSLNSINPAMFGFSPESRSLPPESPVVSSQASAFELDPLAQFFPPSNITDTPPVHVSDGTYRQPLGSSIAPLNLNTSLEGSLNSLRNSIITLASSLDSEVRRHDIALTTESLRVNEEVMALRAVVHGLRMQVHQIMMDRNSQVTGRLDEGVSSAGYGYSQSRNSLGEWQLPVRHMNHTLLSAHRISNTGTSQLQTTKL